MFRLISASLLLMVNYAVASDFSDCYHGGEGSLLTCLNMSSKTNHIPTKGSNGHWVYSIQPDKGSDKPNVFMATLLSSTQLHYLDLPVSMTIRCKNQKANFEIHWQGVKLKEGSPKVLYRFDNKPGQPVQWITAISRQSLEVAKPMAFIERMAQSNFFMVQASAKQSPSINATFNTLGLSNLIPIMKGFCY